MAECRVLVRRELLYFAARFTSVHIYTLKIINVPLV